MRKLRLAPLARADLVDIRAYTRRVWGGAQARAYLEALGRHLDGIASGDVHTRSGEDFAPGYLMSRCQSHYVFCMMDERYCRVVRILHVRSDVTRHLEIPD